MKKFFLIPIILSLIVFTGCAEKKDDTVLRIGAVLPLTGAAATYGQAERKGIEFAVEAVNNAGGVLGKPVEIVFRDDATDPKQSVSAVRSLIDVDNVDAIIGGTWDVLANAIIPVIDEEQMLLLTPSALPDTLDADSEYLFAVHSPISLNQKIFERYLSNYDTPQRVGLVSVNVPWGIAYMDTFKKALANTDHVLAEEVLLPQFDSNDLSTAITKLEAANVDVLLSAINFNDYIQLIKKMEEQDLDLDLLAHSNLYSAYKKGEIADEQMRGIAIFQFSAGSFKFQRAYKARYNEEPGLYADNAFDAVQLLVRAAIAANSPDTEALRAALRTEDVYLGASGPIDFSEKRYAQNKQPILKIHDGILLREFVVGDVL